MEEKEVKIVAPEQLEVEIQAIEPEHIFGSRQDETRKMHGDTKHYCSNDIEDFGNEEESIEEERSESRGEELEEAK